MAYDYDALLTAIQSRMESRNWYGLWWTVQLFLGLRRHSSPDVGDQYDHSRIAILSQLYSYPYAYFCLTLGA